MERTGTNSGKKIAGGLIGSGETPVSQVSRREPTRGTFARSQSMWERPKQEQATYAQQYLHAYNSRWMMRSNSAMSAFNARKSVMSRMQESPAFLQRKDTPTSQ
ncbi:hypothetical protein BSKO_09586 [Bryopsis sp. KO-2023]|nr:hypothetical protein BSKO_09586 [Bryopsis sp. KO-2023]